MAICIPSELHDVGGVLAMPNRSRCLCIMVPRPGHEAAGPRCGLRWRAAVVWYVHRQCIRVTLSPQTL